MTTKTPIRYYGGKQNLAPKIVEIIKTIPHKIYCEPFCGGAAVTFAKETADLTVLNDINGNIANFWQQATFNKDALVEKINRHQIQDEFTFKRCQGIFLGDIDADDLEKAFAVHYLCLTAFSGQLNGSFGYAVQLDKKDSLKVRYNQISAINDNLAKLDPKKTLIFNRDAPRIIKAYNIPETLFYIDPPYINAHQGHYGGYTQDDFNSLLDTLVDLKGSFILSHYYNEKMVALADEHGWETMTIDVKSSATNSLTEKREARTEYLIVKRALQVNKLL